jgi:hypothetical protein
MAHLYSLFHYIRKDLFLLNMIRINRGSTLESFIITDGPMQKLYCYSGYKEAVDTLGEYLKEYYNSSLFMLIKGHF